MYTAKGRHSWTPTQPPLDDEFDAVTYTNLTGFERIDEVDEPEDEDEDEDEFERGPVPVSRGYGGAREEDEEMDTNANTGGRDEIEDSRNGDADLRHHYHPHRDHHHHANGQASTSRDGYAYSHHHHHHRSRSRSQPRVQPSPNPTRTRSRNGHSRNLSDEFASRYVTERERETQQTPRPAYVNGGGVGEPSYQRTNGNELVRSTSRRSSNHNHENGHTRSRSRSYSQTNNYQSNGHGGGEHGQGGPVYRSEEIVRHPSEDHDRQSRTNHSSRRRRDSGVTPRSRSRSRVRPASTTPKPQPPPPPKQKAITNGPIRPPARQQSYEVIKSRVLEDTPEKTVTISTWRERVADEAPARGSRSRREYGYVNRTSEVEMSIYYVDADDYPVEDGNGRVIEEELFEKKGPKSNGGKSAGKRDAPVNWMGANSPRLLKRALSATGSRKGKEREKELDYGDDEDVRSDIRDRVQTPWPPSMSELVDIDEQLEDEENGKRLRHRRSQSLPIEWLDPNEPEPNGTHPNKSGHSHPRTSTPIHRAKGGASANDQDDHTRPANGDSESPYPPKSISLFPTRSNGSTISSIPAISLGTPRPSTSTQPSSIQPLEEVLGSCHPPLSHLGPILFDLGIRTEDHLRAVGKMSEATRDRELKEVALKRGVTVFEWAMLLDKLYNM
ncbi:hypothetical protein PQX77_021196 [Marasmius sp. AFHP31]|nr:hypothetical protein PQX77_021196 [Marasmius sp. AFHP31]